jgi:2-polyprenyl-6-methoxyphenol hydroxylase-like FAD-dependent oxidoreductase
MYGNYSNIVWSTVPSQVEALLSLPDDKFLVELRKAFHGQVEPSLMSFNMNQVFPNFPSLTPAIPKPPHIERIIGKRAAFPLKFTHASEYFRPRLAIVGSLLSLFSYLC